MTKPRKTGNSHNRPQSTDAYEVGYRKPPAAHRFRTGQSGNPKGRPRGRRNLGQVLRSIINGKVDMAERNGRVRRMPRVEAMLQNVMAKAVSGEPKQVKLVLDLMERFDVKVAEENPVKSIVVRYVTPQRSAEEQRQVEEWERGSEKREAAHRARQAGRIPEQANEPRQQPAAPPKAAPRSGYRPPRVRWTR